NLTAERPYIFSGRVVAAAPDFRAVTQFLDSAMSISGAKALMCTEVAACCKHHDCAMQSARNPSANHVQSRRVQTAIKMMTNCKHEISTSNHLIATSDRDNNLQT
ncbi:MAG: hypothetical protein ABL901_08615, partial [Hyphomicrobiaceae bacterium]